MKPLARYEIIEQLDRMGIHQPVERAALIEDYISYFHQKDVQSIRDYFYKLWDFFFNKR